MSDNPFLFHERPAEARTPMAFTRTVPVSCILQDMKVRSERVQRAKVEAELAAEMLGLQHDIEASQDRLEEQFRYTRAVIRRGLAADL